MIFESSESLYTIKKKEKKLSILMANQGRKKLYIRSIDDILHAIKKWIPSLPAIVVVV